MQKIVTFLWFDSQAEEAVNYYVSVFNNSQIGKIARYNEEAATLLSPLLVGAWLTEGGVSRLPLGRLSGPRLRLRLAAPSLPSAC